MSSVFYYTKESIKNFKKLRHLQLQGQEDKILTEEEKEEQGKLNLYKDCAIFIGEIGVIGYPILEEDTVRSATLVELIDLEEQQLLEGEILNREAGTIDKIPQPTWQYKWDFELLKWLPDESTIQDGQYIEGEKIIDVPYDESLVFCTPLWDRISHIWKEGATEEEKKTEWFNRINSWKPKVLEGPFRYIHSDGKTYNQKLRVGKDDTLLSTAIQALIRNAEIPSIEWAFDDNNSVLMTLEDLRKLQDTGFVWTQAVYEAERELKAMSPDFTKDINFFKETALNHVAKYKLK